MKYWFIHISLIFLSSIILVSDSAMYDQITQEDHFVEYTGFVLFLLSGFMLLITASKLRGWEKVIFCLAGMALIFIAGEEISWGQRIFCFSTPESLAAVNDQNEFNLHNINKKLFDAALTWSVLLLLILKTTRLFQKINLLKKFELSLPIILCFVLTIGYRQYNDGILTIHLLAVPFLGILAYNLKSNVKYLVLILATILIWIVIYAIHILFQDHFSISNNSANEIREMLFAASSVSSSIFLFHKIKNQASS